MDRSVIQGLAEIDVDKEVLPVFDVNVFGLLRITRAVFPLLFESKGCIINIASMAGMNFYFCCTSDLHLHATCSV